MSIIERHAAIGALLKDIKGTTFHDPGRAPDEAAMGLLVARYFDGHPQSIIRAAGYALEDANCHELAGYLFGVADGKQAWKAPVSNANGTDGPPVVKTANRSAKIRSGIRNLTGIEVKVRLIRDQAKRPLHYEVKVEDARADHRFSMVREALDLTRYRVDDARVSVLGTGWIRLKPASGHF